MLVAKSGPYAVSVEYDDDPFNPREYNGNFGNMVCWHSRYRLGDENTDETPSKFLRGLIYANIGNTKRRKVIAEVKKGKYDGLKLWYNRSEKEWVLESYCNYFKKWFTEETFNPNLDDSLDLVFEGILEGLGMDELVSLAEDVAEILPLYLYDHSGITMNTTGFSCRWDSGQVGWIYATHDEIKKTYGKLTEETISTARKVLIAEVEEYDAYISGDCYGFRLFESGQETDSCWGFLGSLREFLQNAKSYMPNGHEDMLDNLTEIKEYDLDDYLGTCY